MAKKKHFRETSPQFRETSSVPELEATAEQESEAALADSPSVAADPLVEEVQSFLDRRAALAQKLADEIASTEKKLAELKRTAALLFPEANTGGFKERKVKKVKAKPASRPERSDGATLLAQADSSDAVNP